MIKLEANVNKLAERASEIDVKKDSKLVRKIISDLWDIMTKQNLTSLSAPQIGYPYRIFCILYKTKKGKKTLKAYINPMIDKAEGFVLIRQKCTNFPDKEYIHPRYSKISLMYQDETGKSYGYDFIGQTAFTMEHMVDMLDGVMLEDLGLEIDENFDKATEEEKNQLLNFYAQQLNSYKQKLDKDINENPELKQLKDAVSYVQSVKEGKTQVE